MGPTRCQHFFWGNPVRVGSLFSGIGGLDLGLERAGMTVAWQAEVDPYCSRVLAQHWPDVPNLGDVTKVDWNNVEPVELVCGGFPCQPFSHAGPQRGADDPRYLWPEVVRCVRVLRPRLVLLENVSGLLARGGSMGTVLGDLAELGYDTEWDCIPAAAVGAPHLRYRVFVVAYPNASSEPGKPVDGDTRPRFLVPNLADPESESVGTGLRTGEPTGVGRGRLGNSSRTGDAWSVEPDVGRVAHGIPSRVDRLRALGNAVVPQVAEWIGRRIVGAS
jgi:DNA (cytosine-5)-methyltransferase 1